MGVINDQVKQYFPFSYYINPSIQMLWKINAKKKNKLYTSNSFTGTIFHYRFTCIYNFLTFRATVQTVLGTVYKMTTGDAPFSVIPSVKYNGTHLYTWVELWWRHRACITWDRLYSSQPTVKVYIKVAKSLNCIMSEWVRKTYVCMLQPQKCIISIVILRNMCFSKSHQVTMPTTQANQLIVTS